MNLPEENRPVDNRLQAMQPGETVICQIKRHAIGIFGIYFMAGLMLLVVAVIAFGVAPHFITGVSHAKVVEVGGLVFLVLAVLSFIFVLISSRVYWGNSWVLTSDSLTQITQTSLFDRQSSQLSLGNLEDVTAEQNGILTHMFNYGVLRVETAGERSKFVFTYCPKPNDYAQQILNAREQFEQGRRGQDLQRPYRGEDTYEQPPDNGVNINTNPNN